MKSQLLNPYGVEFVWILMLGLVGCATAKAWKVAYDEARLVHPKFGVRFCMTWFMKQQIAYARQVPLLLGAGLACTVLLLALPANLGVGAHQPCSRQPARLGRTSVEHCGGQGPSICGDPPPRVLP